MLRDWFQLTEQGATDIKKGILYSALANLSLIMPIGLILLLLDELTKPLFGGTLNELNIFFFTGLAGVFLIIIYVFHDRQYVHTYISAYNQSANKRISLAEKIRKLPLSFFSNKDLSEMTTTMMGDVTSLEQTFSHAIPQFFGSIINIIIASIFLVIFNWQLTLCIFIVLPISLLISFGGRKLEVKLTEKHLNIKLIASDGIQEFLDNIKDIKSFGRENYYLKKLDKKLSDVFYSAIKSELVMGSFVTSSQVVLRLGFPIVVIVGAYLLINGQISFFIFLAFLLIASHIYDPLTIVLMQLAEIFVSQVKIKRMEKIEKHPVHDGRDDFKFENYDIEFNNVDFGYNEEKVIKNLSFVAKQGEITALVGPSGSGKSTAVKLATRFWDVDSGKVTLGGVNVSQVDEEYLLKNYSIVFQDVVLFDNTIMENIRIGKENASDEEVIEAAKAAQCEEFIKNLPKCYDTLIGENGERLSGGERQRISIARAILKNAPVILLDEATASLDVENENLVQKALSKLIKNKTVLIIAHRMRIIAKADKIIVLEKGTKVEEGTHDELIKRKGLYERLYSLQYKSDQWKIGDLN